MDFFVEFFWLDVFMMELLGVVLFGDDVGFYWLLFEIGCGGMGMVWFVECVDGMGR